MIDDKGDEIICRAEKNKLLPMIMKMVEGDEYKNSKLFFKHTQTVIVDGRWQVGGYWFALLRVRGWDFGEVAC